LGHVGAVKQHGTADVGLAAHNALVGRALTVEYGANGAIAILLGQGGADADKVVAAAHEHRGHAAGHLLELIHFFEVVVQHLVAQIEARRLHAGHGHGLVRTHTQAGAETLFKQPAQTLGAFAQGAVEGVELVGEQTRLAGQVFLAGGEVGGVEGTQGKDRTAADHDSQNHGECEA